MTKQLVKAGHVVNVANHGAEALDFLMQTHYWIGEDDGVKEKEKLSVILMDLEMPISKWALELYGKKKPSRDVFLCCQAILFLFHREIYSKDRKTDLICSGWYNMRNEDPGTTKPK